MATSEWLGSCADFYVFFMFMYSLQIKLHLIAFSFTDLCKDTALLNEWQDSLCNILLMNVLNKKKCNKLYHPFFSFLLKTKNREGDNFEDTGQQREVHIKFYCNSNKPFGEPSFTGQEGNKYFFDFQTSLVCAASAVQCLVTGRDHVAYDLSPLGLTYGELNCLFICTHTCT